MTVGAASRPRSPGPARRRRPRLARLLLAALAVCISPIGHAGTGPPDAPPAGHTAAGGSGDPFAADRQSLAKRLQDVKTYSADFTQKVFGVRGEVLEQSHGHVWLDRPRFKWVVDEPYPQVLVTEDDKLKLYDPDLEQVTVRPLSKALKDTPVSLLTRDAVELRKHFDVMHVADDKGDSFVIDPTDENTMYREIVLHFDARSLIGLDILDHLGQRTEIRFKPDSKPAPMDADTFKLTVPAGTDVIGG